MGCILISSQHHLLTTLHPLTTIYPLTTLYPLMTLYPLTTTKMTNPDFKLQEVQFQQLLELLVLTLLERLTSKRNRDIYLLLIKIFSFAYLFYVLFFRK